MSAQIRTQQFIRSTKYTPGGVSTIEIPRMADLETLILNLAGTFTYPAGAAGNLRSIGPQALIQRVELICDGKATVISAPGWAFGVASDRTFEGAGGGGHFAMTPPAANAAGSLETQLYVDLMQFDGVKPKESNLRLRNFSIVELKITWAPWSEVFTNAASVPTVFDVDLFVDGNFCTELDTSVAPAFVVKRTSQIIGAESSNSSHQIRLPSGNILRSIKIFTHAYGVASDNIINAVMVSNGLDTRVQAARRALQARQRGYKAPQVGFTEIDFARQTRGDVLLSNCFAVPSPAEPILTLDYNGAVGRRIELVITEIVRG